VPVAEGEYTACRVVEPRTKREEVRVEEAVEINPLLNSRVVDVAFSPVASFVNG
jgi:hypothetical protein